MDRFQRVPTPVPDSLLASASAAVARNATPTAAATAAQNTKQVTSSDNNNTKTPLFTIAGRYQINLKLDKLGSGGFGTVWSAFDTTTGRLVAIKQIHNSAGTGKHKIREIRNEIRLMKRLDSEYVVQYIDHVEMPSHGLFIVMELLEGSLAGLVKRYRPISEQMVAKYTAQILNALEYLHKNGIVHRDIKADNVLYTKSSQLKLADFGIAQTLSQVRPDHVAGSPYWMAPEVIMMTGADFKSDIWSLGCLVIELLTGRPPYFELNQVQAFFRIVNDGNPPIPKGVSQLLFDFLMKCFNKQPELRKSARELLNHPWITHVANSDIPCPLSPHLSPHSTSPVSSPTESSSKAALQKHREPVDRYGIADRLRRFQDDQSDEDDLDGFSSSEDEESSSSGSDSDHNEPITIVIGGGNRPAIKLDRIGKSRPASAGSDRSISSGSSSPASGKITIVRGSHVSKQMASLSPLSTASDGSEHKRSRSRSSLKKRLSHFHEDESDDEDKWFDSDSDHSLELRLDNRFSTFSSDMEHDSSSTAFDPFDNIDMDLSITHQELYDLEREREMVETIRELESSLATQDTIIDSLDAVMAQLQLDNASVEQDGALLSQYLPIPVLELLTSYREEESIVYKVLQLLNCVINGNKPLQEKLCLTGIFSSVCRFANVRYNVDVRAEACLFLVKMIEESSRNLQTFIQCGEGLASLVSFLQHSMEDPLSDAAVRQMISHTLYIMMRILNFKSTTIHSQVIQNTQKNDFCRMMVAFNYVEHIVHVLVMTVDTQASNRNDEVNKQLDKLVTDMLTILFVMSYGDSIVKMKLTAGSTIQRLIAIGSKWPSSSNDKMLLMQCFRNLCADAHTQDNVTQSGMIVFAVRELAKLIDNEDIHDSRTTVCKIYGMLMTILHNLCAYIDQRKEALVKVDGAVQLLITIITRDLKLSELAAQLFIGIGFAKSDITRRAFIAHGGLDCLLSIMQSPVLNWRVNGLDVFGKLLSSDTVASAVETFLIRDIGHAQMLLRVLSTEGINTSERTTTKVLLSPLNTLMQLSDAVAQLFSRDHTFLTRVLTLLKREITEFQSKLPSSRSSSRHVLDVRFIKEMLSTIGTLLDAQSSDMERAQLVARHALPVIVGQVQKQCERDQYHIPAQLASDLLQDMRRISIRVKTYDAWY